MATWVLWPARRYIGRPIRSSLPSPRPAWTSWDIAGRRPTVCGCHLDMQEASGDCADPKGWVHHIVGRIRVQGSGGDRALSADWRSRVSGGGLPANGRVFALAGQEAPREPCINRRPVARADAARDGRRRADEWRRLFWRLLSTNITATFADRLSAEAAVELGGCLRQANCGRFTNRRWRRLSRR